MGLSDLKIKFKKQINMGTWNVVLWINMQITQRILLRPYLC